MRCRSTIISLLVALGCGDSPAAATPRSFVGDYALTDTLRSGTWAHVTGGTLALRSDMTFTLSMPVGVQPPARSGTWSLERQTVNGKPADVLELINETSAGGWIGVPDGSSLLLQAIGFVASYSFSRR